ncbi:radical SAM family heme chaperone HemW [Lignipirellula cremea]|uniref:Heme chaperone HemW n=1 Tax=Lignipirellula cremea TaxID=2528010 RepID=A0A518DLJ9_9BACT|nr:radical SAM family heme chaperone HemW [Lignipirellula cremea]QDU92701.1 Oxygen-independent coproporphyrinogen-III oxidase-like protein [Lignipirellula cremea]
MPPRAAYVHAPFCRHRCGYCNFTVIAGRDDLFARYLAALTLELERLPDDSEVDTLFFGGGTPTHFDPAVLEELLRLVQARLPLAPGGELSVEANPIDLTPEKTELLARHGVNRISMGMQSFNARKLAVLERDHRADDIFQAYERVRATTRSISLDLIFAAPGETLADWQADLRQAIALQPDHISTYGLTYEQGAAFWGRRERGELASAEEELEALMYEAALDELTAAGYEHYEVSNFARPGHRCRHNETYWLGREYFALGPGAARYVDGWRESNHRSVLTWMRRLEAGESPVVDRERLPPEERARERLVFGLRRLEGIDRHAFAAETGYTIEALGEVALADFLQHRLLEIVDDQLRLTRAGLLVSDSLWPSFLE